MAVAFTFAVAVVAVGRISAAAAAGGAGVVVVAVVDVAVLTASSQGTKPKIARCSRYHLFGELMSELEAEHLHMLEGCGSIVIPMTSKFALWEFGMASVFFVFMWGFGGSIRTAGPGGSKVISVGSLVVLHSSTFTQP